jgi:hypothetical protein
MKCFSGDDFVSMANGEKKVLRELRPGDRVLVMNTQKQIEEDEVILMLDSQPKRPGLCNIHCRCTFMHFHFSFILFN